MRRSALALVLLLLAPAPLTAQDDAPTPVLYAACDGPAAFRQAFLATNVGGFLANEETGPLLAPLQELFFATLGEEGGKVWSLLRDYRGRVELFLDAPPTAEQRPEMAPIAVLRLRDDGATDLDALGEALGVWLRSTGGEEGTSTVGGGAWPTLSRGDQHLLLPRRRGDDLVLAYRGPEATGEDLTPLLAATDGPPRERRAGFELRTDLRAWVAWSMAGKPEDDHAFAAKLWDTGKLRELHVRLAPAGPYVSLELEGTFAAGLGGIPAGLAPVADGGPGLYHLIPEDCAGWKDGHLRLDRLFDAALDALAEYSDRSREDLDEEIREETGGVHFVDDLCAHLGGEVLVVLGTGDDEDDPRPFDGFCLVFEVADAEAFAASWAKARPVVFEGMGIQVDSFEHDGVEVHGGTSLFLPEGTTHTAVAGDLAFLAHGTDSAERLAGVLDRRGNPAAEEPAAVRRVDNQKPPGFNGAARLDLTVALGHLDVLAGLLQGPHPSHSPDLSEWVARFGDRLARHKLDQVVTLTGRTETTWTFRLLW